MLKIKDLRIPLYDISLFLFVLYMFRQSLWNADPLLRLIVPFFFAVSIYRIATKKIILKKELKYTLWIGAICGITWLVSMFSLYKEQSFSALQNMFRTGIYVSLILINCKEKKELDKVMTYVWIAGITVVISLIQNFDPRAVALIDESYATSARLGFGGIEHPNTTAYNIYISFAIGVYLFIKYRKIRKLKYLVLLGEIMLIVGCLLTGSRKVLITIILLPLAILVLKSKNPFKLAAQIIVGTVIVICIYNFTQDNPVLYNLVGHRISDISGIITGEDASAAGRSDLVAEGLRVGFEQFWGVGLNCFSYYSSDGAYAHNEFIEIFADIGAIGFMFYYVPIALEIIHLFRHCFSYKSIFNMYWMSLIINILVLSLFQVTFAFFTYHFVLGLIFTRKYSILEELNDAE